MAKLMLKPINAGTMSFFIVGISPLVEHQWSEKAKEMIRQKHAGKKTKTREVRDPEKEAEDAAYKIEGKYGIPGMGFKKSLISAAHKDIGIEKTLVRKAVFLLTENQDHIIPLEGDDPYVIREDMVRVGQGSADLRYRPMWTAWSVEIKLEVDFDLLGPEDVINLVNRGGFGVGLCEGRPEKDGEWGRYKVDEARPILIGGKLWSR